MKNHREKVDALVKTTGKQILFPDAVTLEEIFETITDSESEKPASVKLKNGPGILSPFCTVSGAVPFRTLWVKVRQEVADKIESSLVILDDPMYFKLVVKNNKTVLVIAEYSNIIGSRWIALLPYKSLLSFIPVKVSK